MPRTVSMMSAASPRRARRRLMWVSTVSVVAVELIVPHGTEEFLAGAHAAGILHEILQQAELNGREFHGLVVHGDLVGLRIQAHAVAAQQRIVVFLRGSPAQHGPDAQHEFPRVEGLDHVVVGAEFKSPRCGPRRRRGAVSMMMGMCSVLLSLPSSRQTARPSMRGSMTSRRMSAGLRDRASSRAVQPSAASSVA